jgi:hypothetical protein
MSQLTDDDLMPFGMYKGKAMINVPASYLHYLYTHDLKNHSPGSNQEKVWNYIVANIEVLKTENEDLIWKS